MDIYLLRPGSAIIEGAHLSAAGRQWTRAIGHKACAAFRPAFSHVVASQLPACVQSAELFAERAEYLGIVEIWPELGFGVPAQIAASKIAALPQTHKTSGDIALLVVTDEPALSALGAALIGRQTFPQSNPAQLSLIQRGAPIWFFRADAEAQAPLLVA
jgi:phosphohistidine phosphatase SixA